MFDINKRFKFMSGKKYRDFVVLVSGTSFAQIFSLVFYPILGRMFLPNEFGIISTLSTVSALIVVVASGKYEQGIITTRSKKEAVNLMGLALFSSVVVSSFVMLLLLLFSQRVLIATHNESLIGWIYLCPVMALFIITYNTFNEWCIKKGAFRSLSVNKITNSASLNISKFSLGVAALPYGLIWGELLGRGISAISCVWHLVRVDRYWLREISYRGMKQAAKDKINFPRYIMPDYLINTFAGSLPVFFLSSYFGESVLGYYAMTQNIMAIPMTFVGQAIMDVFKNRANEEYQKDGNCRRQYVKLFWVIFPISFALMCSVIFFMPTLFKWFLGSEWQQAGVYAQILTPAVTIAFVHQCFSPLWIITDSLRQRFYWQIMFFCLMLTAMILGCLCFKDSTMTIVCFSIAYFVAHAVGLYCTFRFSGKNIDKVYVS